MEESSLYLMVDMFSINNQTIWYIDELTKDLVKTNTNLNSIVQTVMDLNREHKYDKLVVLGASEDYIKEILKELNNTIRIEVE